ncbi:MAG: 3'-5' exonuclease [Sphingobacteriaceae bacterium]
MLNQVDLKHVLVLDVETVPQYASAEELPPAFLDLWAQKTEFKRRNGETPEEFYPRAGIWAEFGKIVCISFGMFVKKQKEYGFRIKSFASHDEKEILENFIALLKKQPKDLLLCAHNGKEFDFPYLCRRMLINGLEIPKQLQIAGKKPWEINHLDTMEYWKFGDFKNYTSLNLLATILGIPTPKDDIDGSDVHWVYWKDKDLMRIKTYCQKDVLTTAQLLLKFKGMPTIPRELVTIVD